MTHTIPPWQCPGCEVWLAPGTATHTCGTAKTPHLPPASPASTTATVPADSPQVPTTSASAERSLGSKPSPKRGYNEGYDQDFLEFWSIYPLHKDKWDAQTAFRKAVLRTPASEICGGALAYANDPHRNNGFTKYPAHWLRNRAWEDTDPIPARPETQADREARAQRERDEERALKLEEANEMIAAERRAREDSATEA